VIGEISNRLRTRREMPEYRLPGEVEAFSSDFIGLAKGG
jgi:hypothetical protein